MFEIILHLIIFCVSTVTVTSIIKDKKGGWYTLGWWYLLGSSFGKVIMEALKLANP
jgi:prolipoprotein diacylglyceryltransferase